MGYRFKTNRDVVGGFWGRSYAPWVLVGLLLLGTYCVACSKLTYYIVGGFGP